MSIQLTDLEFSILQNISSPTIGWRRYTMENNNLSKEDFDKIIHKLTLTNLIYLVPLNSKMMVNYNQKIDDNYYITSQGEQLLKNFK